MRAPRSLSDYLRIISAPSTFLLAAQVECGGHLLQCNSIDGWEPGTKPSTVGTTAM